MEGVVEREYSALGNLFQQIIADMKNGTPIWEDFIAKASKLYTVLKSALSAVSAYLDAFQKIADAATNARGATKEIGTALTRMCLRHKAMETRMKTFTGTIMECLVNPLQEKLEDWKKTLINIDKDHSREYKRARSELKKRSTDTLRLQKKARKGKGGDLQRRVETCMQDVNERRQILEDAEKKAVRAALVEERSRFCLFVALLKPVVDSEVAMLAEMSHLQEGAGQLLRHTNEPHSLPAASEQVISDLQAATCGSRWSPPPSPPSPRHPRGGPSSSLCSSVSSLNSSSSGSGSVRHQTADHSHSNSAARPSSLDHAGRSASQPPRLGSVSSRDSGFTSQDTLHLPPLIEFRKKGSDNTSAASSCTTPVGGQDPSLGLLGGDGSVSPQRDACGSATWPDLKDTAQFERAASAIMGDRPHTISSAYERGGHTRPALSVHTFSGHGCSEMTLTGSASQPVSPCCAPPTGLRTSASGHAANSQSVIYARPPLPTRCSSLERPIVPAKGPPGNMLMLPEHKMAKPSSLPPHLTKDTPQATYVNMFELASMAASRAQGLQANQTPGEHGQVTTHEKACESSTSESSLESSSGYGSQGACPVDDASQHPYSMDDCGVTTIDIGTPSVIFGERCADVKDKQGGLLTVSLCSLDEAMLNVEEVDTTPVTFATINKTKPCVPKRRPLSMTATCPPAGIRLAMAAGRRGSSGGASVAGGLNKPPPPVRRSSMSRPHHQQMAHQAAEYINNHNQAMSGSVNANTNASEGDDNLPPPPAFLLNPAEHNQQHQFIHQQQQQQQQMEGSSSRCTTPNAHGGKGINVAETVKALTELKHTPASPSLIRRNSGLQNNQPQSPVPIVTGNPSAGLSSFQQSKSAFTALQNNSNLNPIYGPAGHKLLTYVEQNNSSLYGSRNSSFTNLSANSGLYGTNNGADSHDGMQPNRMNNSTSYNSTVTYSSSPNATSYMENSMSTFGQRNQSNSNLNNSGIYGQTTFGKQPCGNANQFDKKNPFGGQQGATTPGGNTIYAQPSQIIAGFNNLGFGGNRNHEGSMSPLAVRKAMPNPRSQSADRRGSDFGNSGGLIAAISARLAPQLSPRNTRRSISNDADVCQSSSPSPLSHQNQYQYQPQLHHATPSFRTSQDSLASYHSVAHSPQHNSKSFQKGSSSVAAAVQPAFLDKLSATLRQRQSSTSSPNKAKTVRQMINTKAQPDPRVCHGSLMEQIKRGATLKRNKHCNDRSAPKIH